MYMHNPNQQTGFTLVEMLMVILIIAATTKIVAVSMEDFGFAARYEHTISRLDTIRQAIIGNPKRTVNGQPDISGFVADMGRLPDNVRELFQSFVCINTSSNAVLPDTPAQCIDANEVPTYLTTPCSDNTQTTQAACEALSAPNNTWVGLQLDVVNNSGLAFGWNGPYLSVSDNPNNTDTFTDGWGNESANNYGWVTCLWDDGDDTAGGGLANNLPNDTGADGLADCSNTQVYPNYTIYSLGKNGTGDVNADGATACDSGSVNDYDGDCNSTILEEDYTVDIRNGINVLIRKESSNSNGSCSFPISLSSSLITGDKGQACRNASGSASSACYLNQTACVDPQIVGTWNAVNNYCEFTSASCNLAGETWDPNTKTCHISKAVCTGNGGVWTGAVPLNLSPAVCVSKGGSWSNDTGLCTYAAATNCTGTGVNQLSGEWDSVSKTCDFKFGPAPSDTPTNWAISNGGSWGCSISQLSCNKSGGSWNRCDFNANTCNGITGGSWRSSCEFTDSNCNRAGGNWNALTRQCIFSTSTACTNAGFTWGGGSCNAPTQAQCENAGIAWNSYCEFDTSANCGAVGGVWNGATTPKLCGFSSANCLTAGGTPRNGQCSTTQAEFNGTPFNAQSCRQASGVWSYRKQSLCARVFYRSTNSVIITTESAALDITENGDFETLRFTGFSDGGSPVNRIALGDNAFGIYEHDGANCTNNLYPSDRTKPIALQFVPYVNLPVINW